VQSERHLTDALQRRTTVKRAVATLSLGILIAAPLAAHAQQAPAAAKPAAPAAAAPAAPAAVAAPAPAPAPAPPTQQRAAAESAPELPAAIDKLAAQIVAALPKGATAKIAVAPFANLGPTAHEKKLGDVVSELLVTRLSGKPNIVIIERGQIDQILNELKLSMLGLTDGSNAEKVGKLLGADAMIVGSVSEVGDKFAISARHVDTATGRVAFAKEVLVPQAGTIALSSKYIVTKSRGDALFRSLIVPGWGQVYNDQDAKGYVFTGVTLGVIGAGVFQRMQYSKTHDDYMKATTKEDAAKFYDQQSNEYQQSNLLFYIAGGIWALNVADAFLNGTSASEVRVDREAAVTPELGVARDGTRTAGLRWNF
jgi:TolB-like protein